MVKPRAVISFGRGALWRKGEISAGLERIGELIAKLSEKYEIVVVHASDFDAEDFLSQKSVSAETAVAISQGKFGYKLSQAIKNAFVKLKKNRKVATVVTQVVVEKTDPGFRKPTKPIGRTYSAKEALKLMKLNGWIMEKTEGGKYRRLVPSPRPIDVVEKREISDLLTSGAIVVAAGGGGIPVYKTKVLKLLKGIDAVVDEDYAAEKLAELLKADLFVSVTDVENACLNFGAEDEIPLHVLSVREAEKYLKSGAFESGSMREKVEACVGFAKKKHTGIICSLDNLEDSLKGKSGTIII